MAKFFLLLSGRKNFANLVYELDKNKNKVVIRKSGGPLFVFYYFNYPYMKGSPCFAFRKKYDGHNIFEIDEKKFLEYYGNGDFILDKSVISDV